MRGVWMVACLASSGCLAFWTPCDPDDDNLLADGGFESLQCWEDPDGTWEQRVSLDSASGSPRVEPALRVANDAPSSDLAGIRLVQQGGSPLMRATLYIEQGQDVRVSLWSKAEQADRYFEVDLVEVEGGALIGTLGFTADTEWAQSSLDQTDLPEGDIALSLKVGGPDDATLWIDDLMLSVVEP